MNLSLYIEEIINATRKHRYWLFFSVFLFISGIMCGIIIDKPLNLEIYYRDYCSDLIYNIIDKNQSALLLFLSQFFNCILLIVFCIPGGVIVYFLPLQCIIIFYKGFLFGTTCAIIITSYSLNGILILALIMIPQQLIFCVILILLNCSAYENAVYNNKCGRYSFTPYSQAVILAIFASAAAAVLELVTILALIRPLNFIL